MNRFLSRALILARRVMASLRGALRLPPRATQPGICEFCGARTGDSGSECEACNNTGQL